jgi:protein gp37
MGEKTKIEWAHHTFNPWRGCTKVSAGCANCYAEREAHRFPSMRGVWGANGTRILASQEMWRNPLKWERDHIYHVERQRVFCASLADVFEDYSGPLTSQFGTEQLPTMDLARRMLFRLIEDTPHLDWLLLTKRPENVIKMLPGTWFNEGFPANVWMGTSVENQEMAEVRVPHLLSIPAKVRFLSCEPLLSAVNLEEIELEDPCDFCGEKVYFSAFSGFMRCRGGCEGPQWVHSVNWVIAGGESGPGACAMLQDWPLALRDQCAGAEVPFLFKQWGEHDAQGNKVGKVKAGRWLDGLEHNGFPVLR